MDLVGCRQQRARGHLMDTLHTWQQTVTSYNRDVLLCKKDGIKLTKSFFPLFHINILVLQVAVEGSSLVIMHCELKTIYKLSPNIRSFICIMYSERRAAIRVCSEHLSLPSFPLLAWTILTLTVFLCLGVVKIHRSANAERRWRASEAHGACTCIRLWNMNLIDVCLWKRDRSEHVPGVQRVCASFCSSGFLGLGVITALICLPGVCVWVTLKFSLALQLSTSVRTPAALDCSRICPQCLHVSPCVFVFVCRERERVKRFDSLHTVSHIALDM